MTRIGVGLAALVGVILAFGQTTVGGEKKPAEVREIAIKGVPEEAFKGNVKKPTVIDNDEKLAKFFPAEETQTMIKKEVDLKKSYLLVFGWSGSGQDKLTFKTEKDKVVFEYTPGKTRDLRQHFHAYAIMKGLAWEVK